MAVVESFTGIADGPYGDAMRSLETTIQPGTQDVQATGSVTFQIN